MAMPRATTLTDEEKRVIKALANSGVRNQDIHALVNYERPVTINFGRISGVKADGSIVPATAEEVEFFKLKKKSFDPTTGLNKYFDERLIRSREAMILAVCLFNGAGYKFKTELFPYWPILRGHT